MTDELDDLRRALKAAPAPDADAKARAMQLAMENFDRLQGSTDPARSSEDRPSEAAPLNGVRRMLKLPHLPPRPRRHDLHRRLGDRRCGDPSGADLQDRPAEVVTAPIAPDR